MTHVSDTATLLDDIVTVAEAAGERILAIARSGFAIAQKADASPVTIADQEAETFILARLAALTPSIPAVSEEACGCGNGAAACARFWLVDPLDGTKEFCARIGEFTVNIALIEDGLPVLGVVHVPVSGETYAGAGPGSAVKRVRGGAPEPIAARKAPADGLVMLTSRFHKNEAALNAFLDSYLAREGTRVKETVAAGSALKFGLIAAGVADLYPRLGPTMEWDTAAGHAVVLAAGGRLTALDGGPFRYGKPEFRNPGFVVRGR